MYNYDTATVKVNLIGVNNSASLPNPIILLGFDQKVKAEDLVSCMEITTEGILSESSRITCSGTLGIKKTYPVIALAKGEHSRDPYVSKYLTPEVKDDNYAVFTTSKPIPHGLQATLRVGPNVRRRVRSRD